MTTNIYGLRLRSAVRSRRRRLLRSTIGLALLALLCLVYPGARDLTAQLLGIDTEPSVAADAPPDEPAFVAAKKSQRRVADNPLAADARAAAGLILPTLPSETELPVYVAGESPVVLELDADVSDAFRDAAPASVAANNSGGGRLGGRSPMVPSPGSAGGGFGGVGGASAAPTATIAANETPAGDQRVNTLGHRIGDDLASTATAASIEPVNGNDGVNGGPTPTSGAASPTSGAASKVTPPGSVDGGALPSGGGAATSATGGSGSGATSAFAEAAAADIAPSAVATAGLAGGGAPGVESSGAGAQSPSNGELAADAPGILADVPEPATLLIFSFGLAAVAYRRSRLV